MSRRLVPFPLAVVLLLAACTSSEPPTPPPTSSGSTPAPTPGGASPTVSPSPLVPAALRVRVADVAGAGPRGDLRAPALQRAADAVAGVLARMFTIAFVDREAWAGGDFTSLFRLFEADLRDEAHRDLRELTLGPLARAADGANPSISSAEIRFLANASGRPVVAIAATQFAATVRDGDARAEVAQTGRYVLRWSEGAWWIAGYDVSARIPASFEDPAAAPAGATFAPGIPATEPLFLLAIGSDARPRQAVTRTRADSLHVIGVDPRSGSVSILGIPRDTWTAIPGHGTGKINASLTFGGPEVVVETVERLTGIPIDAYALTGFEGFVDAIGGIHGIDIRIPYPISDRYAHARFRRGPTHLGGKEALAFARARHTFKDGDFERSLNQGRLLIAAAATLSREVRGSTGPFVRWALETSAAVKTDLAIEDLFELLVAVPTFDPNDVANEVAPGHVSMIGKQSVVLLDARARAMFRDLARDGVLDG